MEASVACGQDCPLRTFEKELRPDSARQDVYPAATPHTQDPHATAQAMYTGINSEWQIRILTLLPGRYGTQLVGHLSVADMILHAGVVLHERQVRVQYTALSYCWGEQTYPRLLVCNGFEYPITENLLAALQRLRNPNREVYLWVDAVCINQYDDAERSRQVAGMLTIFQKAATVVAWLGEHERYTEHALRVLSLGKRLTGDVADHSPACQKVIECAMQGLQNIALRPWFRRVWVKQEVWASQALVVRCGSSDCQWESFTNLQFVDQSGGSMPWWFSFRARLGSFVREPRTEILLRDEYGERSNVYLIDAEETRDDIVNVLRRSEDCECSDSRDHVYGILGMSSAVVRKSDDLAPLRQAALAVDYTRPASVVFADLARYVMQRDGLLNVLCLDGIFGTTHERIALPSWVPDWRVQTTNQPWLGFLCEHPGYMNAVACADESRPWSIGAPRGDDTILSLRGFVVGRIYAVALPREVIVGETPHSIMWPAKEPADVLPDVRALKYRFPAEHNVASAIKRTSAKGFLDACIAAQFLDDPTSGQSKARLLSSCDTIGLDYHEAQNVREDPPSVATNALEWKTWYRCYPSLPNLKQNSSFDYDAHLWRRTQFVRAEHYLDITSSATQPQLWPTNRVDWLAQETALPGDEIVLVERGMLPLVVRPSRDGVTYEYVGPAIPTTWAPDSIDLRSRVGAEHSWHEDPELRVQRLKQAFRRREKDGLLHDIRLR